MTQISEIHGIGRDEYADRGAMVSQSGFFPYLSLTQGEARLWLAAQRAKTLAQWYGSDAPQYAQAAQMLENALHAGVSNGVHFVGAVPDYLQNVARMIQQASRQTQPATRDGLLLRPQGIVRGIGQLIPYGDRYKQCVEAAKKLPALKQAVAIAKCAKQLAIEKIINDKIEPSAHHMLYKSLPTAYTVPGEVRQRIGWHKLGVEGLANVGEIRDFDLMYQWVENAIIKSNAIGGVGAIGSEKSSFALAPNPEMAWATFTAWSGTSSQKWRPGAINGLLDIVQPLLSLLKIAVDWALKMLSDLQKKDVLAMVEARGFGTPTYSGSQQDWVLGPENPETSGLDTNTILLLAAAAGLVLYASGDN